MLQQFIEVLNPSKVLSLAFQEEDTDIVSVVAAIEKNEKAIEKISRQKFRGIAYGKEFFWAILFRLRRVINMKTSS